jgi:phenylacetate-CoA ligase
MNNKYWEEEIETMSREKLQELQLQRLKKTIKIAANSPYYKKVFQEHNITADDIQSLDDIQKIPFTTKSDMRACYPFGMVSGNMQEDGVRIHQAEPPVLLPSSSTHNTTWTLGPIW